VLTDCSLTAKASLRKLAAQWQALNVDVKHVALRGLTESPVSSPDNHIHERAPRMGRMPCHAYYFFKGW
jgi:hypothetical protein